jgi:hypothetical protein
VKEQDKYLMMKKDKHFGFLIQILSLIWSIGFFFKLLGRMPKAWILNSVFMFF